MSEHLASHSPEHHHRPVETEARPEHRKEVEQGAESKEHSPDNSIESIRQSIEEQAAKTTETKVDNEAEANDKQPLYVNRELKSEALRRSLNRTRKHLSAPEKALSKAVHQPTIDAISEVGARTIARPTGLLTGSIIALAGSSYLLWSAKHYGYHYNYLVVFLLFVSGYLLGLIIEIFIYTIRKLRHSR